VSEVRVRNERTGGEKGSKPERMDLVPPRPLLAVSRVYSFGATKYADWNWAKGYAWSLSYAACMRHLLAFWNGEDNDPESGEPHLAHAAFHLFTLLQFMQDHRDLDDRYRPEEPEPGVVVTWLGGDPVQRLIDAADDPDHEWQPPWPEGPFGDALNKRRFRVIEGGLDADANPDA